MRDQESSAPAARPGGSRRPRLTVVIVGVAVAVGLAVFGLHMGAETARQKAIEHISKCEFAPAQRCLAWSARLAPGDYATDLLKAACYRQLDHPTAWKTSLEEAARKGAPPESILAERELERLRRSGPYAAKQDAQAAMGVLQRAGVSERDLITTLVLGALTIKQGRSAKALLESMPPGLVSEAHREYLWGAYLRGVDEAAAEVRFSKAIEAQPTHELACADLAGLFEQTQQLDRALREYADLETRSGGSIAATLGVARVLRKLGRLAQSRAVLSRLAADPEPPPAFQREMAQVALASGEDEEAERWFLQVLREETYDRDILLPAAHAFLLRKKPLDSQRLCTKLLDWEFCFAWLSELRMRVASKPGDVAALEELKQETARLNQPSAAPPAGPRGDGASRAAKDAADASATAAAELYRLHCGACHGDGGDGQGICAGLVFPRPRDLRNGRCRIVSTLNGVATLEDVERLLAQGMPGTSMQSFQDLPEADRRLLAREVLRLRREGVRDQVTRALGEEGEEVEEAEVRQAVERFTEPSEPVRPPSQWPSPGQAAAKGKTTYAALGCNKCHGDDGTGSADPTLFDDQGEPSRARDLVHEPFKGGREPEAIYVRVVAGMPGTAHPAVLGLPQDRLIALVDYVRSLAREPQHTLNNHERRLRAAGRAYLEWLRKSSTESSTRRHRPGG